MSKEHTAEYKLYHYSIPVIVPRPFSFSAGISSFGVGHTNNDKISQQMDSGAVEYELRYGYQLAQIVGEGGYFYFQNPERDAPLLYQWLHETLNRYIARKRSGFHTKEVNMDLIENLDILAKFVYERAKSHVNNEPLESGGSAKTARFFANRNFDRFRKTETEKAQLRKDKNNSKHSSIMEDLISLTADSKFSGNRG